MKALYLIRPNHIELRELPEPEPVGDLVRIKIIYAGICGTDLHHFRGEYDATQFPMVLGHEMSGVVDKVGPDVKRLKPGDRVTCETAFATCRRCIYCLSEDYNLCSHRIGLGTKRDGAYAQYTLMPEARIHRLPDGVSFLSGALTEPLACGVHSVMEKALVQAGEVVCVFGAGAIGLMVAQVAMAAGAVTILAGLNEDAPRLELARQLGVSRTVDQQAENLRDVVNDMTASNGVHAAFECAGSLRALALSFELVRKKGRVVQMGVYKEKSNPIPTDLLLHKEIQYVGSRSQKPSSWRTALALLEKGKVKAEELVGKIVPLERWQEVFPHGDGIKNILQCNSIL